MRSVSNSLIEQSLILRRGSEPHTFFTPTAALATFSFLIKGHHHCQQLFKDEFNVLHINVALRNHEGFRDF